MIKTTTEGITIMTHEEFIAKMEELVDLMLWEMELDPRAAVTE